MACAVSRLFSVKNLTYDRLFSDLMWFLCRFCPIRYVEFGSFRNWIGFFSASHVYICDNKGSEILSAT